MKLLFFGLIDFLSWPFTFLLMIAAAVPVAFGGIYIYQNVHIIIVLSLIPVYYFLWLLLFLIISSIEMSIVGLFIKKPDYLEFLVDIKTTVTAAIFHTMSRRLRLVWSLPFIQIFLIPTYTLPFLSKLAFQSYSLGKVRIGKLCAIYSFPTDPDLCIIGNNVVVGGDSLLVSHTVNTKADGRIIYQTAPVILEDNVTIGGKSFISKGVTVKKGALVQSHSFVLPDTLIYEYEVWGGNPAKFIRMRTGKKRKSQQET